MPKLPDAVKAMQGTLRPCRVQETATADRPLGPAPKHLTREERNCWKEIASNAADGVLTVSERWAVEIAARLMAKYRATGALMPSELGKLCGLLSALGATPVDRVRVVVAPPPPDNSFNEFTS